MYNGRRVCRYSATLRGGEEHQTLSRWRTQLNTGSVVSRVTRAFYTFARSWDRITETELERQIYIAPISGTSSCYQFTIPADHQSIKTYRLAGAYIAMYT
jgi:hypothetical protein